MKQWWAYKRVQWREEFSCWIRMKFRQLIEFIGASAIFCGIIYFLYRVVFWHTNFCQSIHHTILEIGFINFLAVIFVLWVFVKVGSWFLRNCWWIWWL